MSKVTIKYVGQGYRGTDTDGTSIVVANGAHILISEEKAKQLLKDYPKAWTLTGGGTKEKAQETKETVLEQPKPSPSATEAKGNATETASEPPWSAPEPVKKPVKAKPKAKKKK